MAFIPHRIKAFRKFVPVINDLKNEHGEYTCKKEKNVAFGNFFHKVKVFWFNVTQIHTGLDFPEKLHAKYCFYPKSRGPVNEALKSDLPGSLPLNVDFIFLFKTRIPTVNKVIEITIANR